MTREAATYIEQVANGTVPSQYSEERTAYDAWSKESAKVSGTWAEFKLMEIQSEARTEVLQVS